MREPADLARQREERPELHRRNARGLVGRNAEEGWETAAVV
jgi:hypothetical protein